jgi:hypothetical protein
MARRARSRGPTTAPGCPTTAKPPDRASRGGTSPLETKAGSGFDDPVYLAHRATSSSAPLEGLGHGVTPQPGTSLPNRDCLVSAEVTAQAPPTRQPSRRQGDESSQLKQGAPPPPRQAPTPKLCPQTLLEARPPHLVSGARGRRAIAASQACLSLWEVMVGDEEHRGGPARRADLRVMCWTWCASAGWRFAPAAADVGRASPSARAERLTLARR